MPEVLSRAKPNLYPIKGGIGKCVVFTALIEKLANKTGRKIAVGSGFPGVFASHPKVAATMRNISSEAISTVANRFEDIVMREPYISAYCKGDRHILDEWARLYELEPFESGGYAARPDLVINNELVKHAGLLRAKIAKPFFIVQWTGGQPPGNFKDGKKYPSNSLTNARNVRNYKEIMLALAEAYPEHLFLLYALPNEPVEMPARLRGRVVRAKAPALAYAGLLKYSDGFVALDSSLQHFGAARQINKNGVVLWGQKTTPEKIGYAFHVNLNSIAANEVIVPAGAVVDALAKSVPAKR